MPLVAIASAVGTGMQVAGTISQGNAAKEAGRQQQLEAYRADAAARAEAAQERIVARQKRTAGQIEGEQYRAAGARLLSDQRVALASTGFASDDQTSKAIKSATLRELTINELLGLAMSEDEAKGIEYGATLREHGGAAMKASGDAAYAAGVKAQKTSRLLAIGQAAQGFVSWRDRYGSGSSGTSKPKLGSRSPSAMEVLASSNALAIG